jgi:hypothetical protein
MKYRERDTERERERTTISFQELAVLCAAILRYTAEACANKTQDVAGGHDATAG